MKNKTALNRSKGSVRFLGLAVPLMWGLFIWLRRWQLAMFATFMTFYLVMDVWNIFRIKKVLKSDPEFLNKKVEGT